MRHITMIHGIRNKPPGRELLAAWTATLAAAGLDLERHGITASMVYWADVMHERPRDDDRIDAEAVPNRDDAEQTEERYRQVDSDFARRLERSLETRLRDPGPAEPSDEPPEEFLPRPLARFLMKQFVWEVFNYLTNKRHEPRAGETYQVQDEVRSRFLSGLEEGGLPDVERHVVLAHSMGTVIAYDCLKRVSGCPQVDAIITLGSPLGLAAVQGELRPEWTREDGYPASRLRDGWTNIADPLDLVSIDTTLAGEYRHGGSNSIDDRAVSNPGRRRPGWDHHAIHEYLQRDATISALRHHLRI